MGWYEAGGYASRAGQAVNMVENTTSVEPLSFVYPIDLHKGVLHTSGKCGTSILKKEETQGAIRHAQLYI
jgi:hypothetical protein